MSKQLPDDLRHAFRALLRAATYLPDSAARTYIHNYTVHRFRSVADKIKSKNAETAEKLIAKYHDNKRIAKVWQAAHQLERAGQSNERDLKKALYLTYGRAGKRRRELIQDLLEPEENSFPEDQAALEKLINKPSEKERQGKDQNSKLKAFIKSQRFNHPADAPRGKITQLRPQIPEENIWGRPVPLRRQENIRRAYWADTLDKLMPPVPRYEWDRLRDLATGAIPIEEPPPRRIRAREVHERVDQNLWEYFSIPTNRLKLALEEIELNADDVVTHWGTRMNPHTKGLKTLTPRFMRRLYATIWSMTPTMSQDEVTKAWTTKWGGARSAAHSGQVTAPSASDMELFEGVDEKIKGTARAKSRDQKRREKRLEKQWPQDRPPPRTSLGEDGYTQGVVPAI
jgi:predicted DNA-binding WGR domain protein